MAAKIRRREFLSKTGLAGVSAWLGPKILAAPGRVAAPGGGGGTAEIADVAVAAGTDYGAMTVRAVPLDDRGEEAWGAGWTAWADAPSTVRDLVRGTIPVAKKKAKKYGIELALWSVESPRPLWAARTTAVSKGDLRSGVGDLLRLTIESLKDTPWLGP